MNAITRFASTASLLVCAAGLSAQVISVNFSASSPPFGFGPFYLLGTGDSAGVVPASNWNNVTILTGNVLDLNDSTGVATTLDLNLPGGGTNYGHWGFYGASTADQRMLGGFIEDPFGAFSFSLSQIPYALYDLYVYSGPNSDRTDRAWNISDGTTTFYGLVGSVPPSGFLQATATAPSGAVAANYVKFSNLTSDSLTVTLAGMPSLSGIQVVAVPEPATYGAFLAAGALLVILRRRLS